MNVECQTIRVPTGVQDYRPALYGGIAAIELGVAGIRRVALDVDPGELERRIVLAYTGAPRNSGTNNWEITKRHLDGDRELFDCFERIRDTAAAMRDALQGGDWDEVGRQIAREWENRKRLAPGVTTPTIDDLIARATAAGAHSGQGLRRRRRRVPVLLRSARRAGVNRRRARRRRRSRARLPHRDGRPAAWITWRSRASCGRSPICSRSRTTTRSRSARIATAPTSSPIIRMRSPRSTSRRCARFPASARISPSRIREIADTGGSDYHRELVAEFPPSILDLLHLQGVGPKTVATLYRELGIRTLDDLERAAADGRIRALRGMGAKKEALILKALEERKRHAGRHLLPAAHDAAAALVAYLRERAPSADILPVGSLRRGCDTCGDLDILASGADQGLMDAFVGHPLVERVLARGETKSSVLLRGGFQADLRLVACRKPRRRHAVLHRIESAQHRAARSRHRPRLQAERIRPVHDRGATRASPAQTRKAFTRRSASRGFRRSCGKHAARSRPPTRTAAALIDRADLRGDLHMHTHRNRRQGRQCRPWPRRRERPDWTTSPSPITARRLAMANGLDERRALAHAARVRSVDGVHGVRLLAGIECDIRPDGTMDLADDCLSALDLVVASVHSAFNQDRRQMTDRLLRAIENPQRRHPRPPDRPADLEARTLSARHGSDRRRRGATWCRPRDQLPGRSARSERCPCQAGPRRRRPASSSRAMRTRAQPSARFAGVSWSPGAPGSSLRTSGTHARSTSSRRASGGDADDRAETAHAR